MNLAQGSKFTRPLRKDTNAHRQSKFFNPKGYGLHSARGWPLAHEALGHIRAAKGGWIRSTG